MHVDAAACFETVPSTSIASSIFAMQLLASTATVAERIEPPAVDEPPDEPPGEPADDLEPSTPTDDAPSEPSTAAASTTTPPAVQRPTPPPPAATSTATSTESAPAVSDATWRALKGKRIVVQTPDGAREGELAAADGPELVLIADDGRPFTVAKSDATDVRVADAPAKPTDPVLPTTPPPSSSGAEPESGADTEPTDPEDARAQKRKERREKREHALLGAFTAHGAAYAHWRGAGVNAGHAAYLMDWGVGVNLAKSFGMYAMGGGVLGARIDDKTIRANYGHLAFMFAFGGKYYFSMLGAGVAFNRLKMETETQKDIGLSIPGKIFGKIPLPKKLYIGIGLSYELGLVRGFGRFVNAIGGQIVFGRW